MVKMYRRPKHNCIRFYMKDVKHKTIVIVRFRLHALDDLIAHLHQNE